MRSLAQPCSVNNTFFSLWEGQKWGFFPKDRTYRAFLHNTLCFADSPEGFSLLLGQCAALRSLAQSTRIPRDYQKKSLLCRKARYVPSLGKKPHFWPSQRLKKVLLTEQGCARLRTGLIITQIPRGYQKKKFIV